MPSTITFTPTEQFKGGNRKSGGFGFSTVITGATMLFLGWVLLGSVAIWDNQVMILLILGAAILFMMRSR